jgi:hypothetical protein
MVDGTQPAAETTHGRSDGNPDQRKTLANLSRKPPYIRQLGQYFIPRPEKN